MIPPMAGLRRPQGWQSLSNRGGAKALTLFETDQVRAKRRGKSSPRGWQHPWQGKPHLEQDQIGKLWRGSRRLRVGCLSVR